MWAVQSSRTGRIGLGIKAARSWFCLLVSGWAVIIYCIVSFLLPGRVPPGINIYLIQPLLWLSLALLAGLGWWVALEERPSLRAPLLITAVIAGALQVALFVLAGLLIGFFRSPYGHSPLVLLGNLFYVGTLLIGLEMSRAYLVVAIGRRRPWLAIGLGCLFFSFLNVSAGVFQLLVNPISVLPVVGEIFLPTLAQNLLASLLAILGGPGASFAYLGVLWAFEWLSPILPNTSWIVTAFLGTLVPTFGFLVVYNRFAVQPEPKGESDTKSRQGPSTTAWLLVAGIGISLFGLNSGLLGVRPYLVASGSMTPRLQVGDVVIIREVPAGKLQVDDIIGFREGASVVIHRVVDIETTNGQVVLITRGDANNTDDEPVLESALEGRVVLTIPKIGWIAIGIRQAIARIV